MTEQQEEFMPILDESYYKERVPVYTRVLIDICKSLEQNGYSTSDIIKLVRPYLKSARPHSHEEVYQSFITHVPRFRSTFSEYDDEEYQEGLKLVGDSVEPMECVIN